MDQEQAPVPADQAAVPAVRASDSDRDRALELLSTAASDGRLTLDEYSARADRALTARLIGELAQLTADLQQMPDAPAEGPLEYTAILGSEHQTGRWTVPSHLEVRCVLGDCQIELQDAVLSSHVTTISARATLGSVTIFVPDGVEVRLSGRSILGSKECEVRGAALPGAPVIDVRATAVLGSVNVMPPAKPSRIPGGSDPSALAQSKQGSS
jgi:hypothetical protein